MNSHKIIFLFALLFSFAFNTYSQANFNFEKTDHNFGDVPAGKDTLWYDFKFTNTGPQPLEISDVRTSCDCTLAEWPKEAVQPGTSKIIRGGFKIEGKSGRFDKSIIIFANTQPATTILNITGNVIDKKP
jgi:hypothetical protein